VGVLDCENLVSRCAGHARRMPCVRSVA
jgi:hypothetical protein